MKKRSVVAIIATVTMAHAAMVALAAAAPAVFKAVVVTALATIPVGMAVAVGRR